MNKEQRLRAALEPFIEHFLPALDCDGCTRFVACMLKHHKIDFEIYECGIKNRATGKTFPIHNFIETKNGIIFDFKTEKWIGCKSDKTDYIDVKRVNKDSWILLNKMPESVLLGTLLMYGVKAPIATMVKNG